MIVRGVADGSAVFETVLPHGGHPDQLAWDRGWVARRPVDAVLEGGQLVLQVEVRARNGEARPRRPRRSQDPGLVIARGVAPEVRQRLAAYAVVLSDRGVLATEYSDQTAVAGRWGMPGGGLDDGEAPVDAVLREVAEETSQTVTLSELVRVQTSHWVGRSPRGTIEDFHAVRLIYTATCAAPVDPVVLDQGGTTESARWLPVRDWRTLRWTHNWAQVLGELLPAG